MSGLIFQIIRFNTTYHCNCTSRVKQTLTNHATNSLKLNIRVSLEIRDAIHRRNGSTHHADETLEGLPAHLGLELAYAPAKGLDDGRIAVPPGRRGGTVVGVALLGDGRRGARFRLHLDQTLRRQSGVRGQLLRRVRRVRRDDGLAERVPLLLLPRRAVDPRRDHVRLGVLSGSELGGVVAVDHQVDVLVLVIATPVPGTAAIVRGSGEACSCEAEDRRSCNAF